jgi:hypothetical protein
MAATCIMHSVFLGSCLCGSSVRWSVQHVSVVCLKWSVVRPLLGLRGGHGTLIVVIQLLGWGIWRFFVTVCSGVASDACTNVLQDIGCRRIQCKRCKKNHVPMRLATHLLSYLLGVRSSAQVAKWFEYDFVFKTGSKVPRGELCSTCGRICESWPEKSLETIEAELASDPIFQALWRGGRLLCC